MGGKKSHTYISYVKESLNWNLLSKLIIHMIIRDKNNNDLNSPIFFFLESSLF